MSRKPIRCLVIQLRSGADLLESLIALKATKQLYPALEISLLCRPEHEELAKQAQWIHSVITLPVSEWLNPGNKSDVESIRKFVPNVAGWLTQLTASPWDLLVNWSFCDSSSFLSALIPAKNRLGYTRRADLDFSSGDGWSQFVHAFVHLDIPQNIHLVDLLTTQLLTALQLSHGDPADAGNQAVTGRGFFTALRTSGDPLLEPGKTWVAAQINPLWSAKQWARFLLLTLERHPETHVVLLGLRQEQELAREITRILNHSGTHEKRILNLTGETDLDLWIDSLSQCTWLVTFQALPAQLASALGTRVLQIGQSHAPNYSTAAYGNGHVLISPTDVSVPLVPEAVYSSWSYAHFEWSHRRNWSFQEHLERLGYQRLSDWLDVRVSKIRPADEGGGLIYTSEFKRPLSNRDWLAIINGQIARLWYCGWTAKEGAEITRDGIGPALLQDLRALDESSSVLLRVCKEAIRCSTELQQRAAQLKSSKVMSVEDRKELHDMGVKILELQKLVDRLASADAHLAGFSTLLKVLMHNLGGEHIAEVSKESLAAWQQIERGIELMRVWMKHTLRLSRPIAVEAAVFQPLP
ncbi:MAG: hypothetical protein RJB38_2321 [Pseudomonadota bacterium]|jgi:ADP-heptose:LPS heptosyltransferase